MAATPIAELSELTLGSRPAARGGGGVSLATLRAIPWVFSWAQSRAFLPAWYGLGTAVEGYEADAWAAAPRSSSRRCIARRPSSPASSTSWRWPWPRWTWPWPARYASLAPTPDGERIWADHPRRVSSARWRPSCASRAAPSLLDATPSLQRSIQLRNPYVDSLSELQVMLLGRLRALARTTPRRARAASASCS